MPDVPAWLSDDAAAYDILRDAAARAAASLAAAGDIDAARQMWHDAITIDTFVRTGIDDYRLKIDRQLRSNH